MTDRTKVNKWLDSIQEFDEATRSEVLDACKNDLECRKYFVMRAEECNQQSHN